VWRLALLWVIAAAVAVAIWSPVVIGLQDKGGYAAVMANHRQYVVGWSEWLSSLTAFSHDAEQWRGSYWLHLLRGALIVLSARAVGPERFTWNDERLAALFRDIVTAGVVVVWTWHPVVFVVCSLIALVRLLVNPRTLPMAVGIVWLVGLSLVTPLYTAYPRIWLPWLLAVALIGAKVLSQSVTGLQARLSWAHLGRFVLPCVISIAFFGNAVEPIPNFRASEPSWIWTPRTDIVRAARHIRDQIEQQTASGDAVVYVYAEPALVFQLRLLGLSAVQPVQHLNFARAEAPVPTVPTFVVMRFLAEMPMSQEEWIVGPARRLKRIKVVKWECSPIVGGDWPGRGPLPSILEMVYRLQ
jgi:hypothetical protein